MENSNRLMLILGVTISFAFLLGFIKYSYPFYLFWVSLGLVLIICGFYLQFQEFKDKIAYFLILCVILFQWTIVVYIYFFSPIYINTDFYLMFIVSAFCTISFIAQFFNIPFCPFNEYKKSVGEGIGDIKWTWNQTVLILLGLLVFFVSSISYIIFNSLLCLYFSLFGVMIIIYGYYLEINKVKMSFKYFLLMSSVIITQYVLCWVIWKFDSTFNSGERDVISFITICVGSSLYLQVARSDMKYFGMYRKKSKKNKSINTSRNSYHRLDLNLMQKTHEFLIGKNIQVFGEIQSINEVVQDNKTVTYIFLKVNGLKNPFIVFYHSIVPFKEGDSITVYGEYYIPDVSRILKEVVNKKLPGIKVVKMKKS